MLKRGLVLLLALSLLAGCWSRKELNDVALVFGLGIDRNEAGNVEVTMGIALSGAAAAGKGQRGGAERRKVLLKREGRTLTEAIRKAETASSRHLVFYHIRAVVLGQRMAEQGIDTVMDYLLRSPEVRLKAHIMMLRDGSVSELMEADPVMETLQATSLDEMASLGTGISVSLKEFFIARASRYKSPFLPVITLRRHPTAEKNAPTLEAVQSGAAIIKGDKVAAYLAASEARGAMWLYRNIREATVTVPCPGFDDKFLSIRVIRARRAIRPVWDGNRVRFQVALTGQMYISDMQCPLDLTNLGELNAIRTEVQQALERRVSGVIAKSQAIPADPFDFNDYVRTRFPALFRQVRDQWPQYWADVPVSVSATVPMLHVNMTNTTPTGRTR